MRQNRFGKLLILFLLFSISIFSEVKKIDLVTFEYPPYMGENKVSKEGVLVELVQAAFKESGIETELTILPVKRAMSQITENKSFAYIGLISNFDSTTIRRLEEIPLMNIRFVLFYLKEQFPRGFIYTKYSDLKDYTLGVLLGGLTDKIADQNNLKKEAVVNIDLVFRKLYAKRNDFAVAVDLSGIFLIDDLFKTQNDKFSYNDTKPFVVSKGSIILNKEHPDYNVYSKKLKEGMKVIYKNGTWMKIMEKYYGKGKVPKDSEELFKNTVTNLM